jgi:hypothetical protein
MIMPIKSKAKWMYKPFGSGSGPSVLMYEVRITASAAAVKRAITPSKDATYVGKRPLFANRGIRTTRLTVTAKANAITSDALVTIANPSVGWLFRVATSQNRRQRSKRLPTNEWSEIIALMKPLTHSDGSSQRLRRC